MATIGIFRHGSTKWNKEGRAQGSSDIPLDNDGLNEAIKLAERLRGKNWCFIYSSDLLRAKQTAEIISSKTNIPIIFDHRLREVDGGLIEGTTEEERNLKWGKNWRELDLAIENSDKVLSRVLSLIDEITIKHKNENILIVSHGSIIKQILIELVENFNLNESIKNTSITIISKPENRWECEMFNCKPFRKIIVYVFQRWLFHLITIYHHCGGQSSRFNRCPALVARSGIAEKQLIQGSLKAKSGDTPPSLTESVKPEPKKSISKARTLPVSSGVSVIQTRYRKSSERGIKIDR